MGKFKYCGYLEGATEITFRSLTLEEANNYYPMLSSKDPFVEEHVFNLITDNQYDTDDLDAGIIPSIIFMSFKASGILKTQSDLPDKIDELRKDILENIFYQIFTTIIKTQPSYNLDELKKKTTNEIIELFVFSEMLIGKAQFDTKKARENIVKEVNGKSVPVKKGINAVTREEIDALKEVLGLQEFNGKLLDP